MRKILLFTVPILMSASVLAQDAGDCQRRG